MLATQTISKLFHSFFPKEEKPPIFPVTTVPQYDNQHLLMGFNTNHYKWQDEVSLKGHQLFIGEHIYNKYDTFLAKQAIEKNKEAWLCNFSEINDIIHFAKSAGREKDLRIFHFSENINYPQYQATLKQDFDTIARTVVYSVATNVRQETLINSLVKQFTETEQDLTLSNFEQFLTENTALTQDLYNAIIVAIKEIKELAVFDINGTNINHIHYGNPKINIIDFGLNSSKLKDVLATNYLANSICSLNLPPSDLPPASTDVRLIFLRDMAVQTTCVVSYQAKAWKFSFNYSYSSLKGMKEKLGWERMLSIIPNASTKVLSTAANQDMKLLNKLIYGDSIYKDRESIVENFVYTPDNSNRTLLVKKEREYPITF